MNSFKTKKQRGFTLILVPALNYSHSESVKRRMPEVVCAFTTAQGSRVTSSVPWDRDGAYDTDKRGL